MSVESITRVVLCDVGNVLVRATHAITWAILENLGVSPKDARRFFDNPAYGAFARGEINGDEFADQTVHHERIAAEIGEEPRRICFVDDDAQNIARAARAGFDTVRFTDAGALVGALQARRIWTA